MSGIVDDLREKSYWIFQDFDDRMQTKTKDYVMSESSKHVWRPPQTIRAKVIGLILHEERLLVCEVLDDHANRKGWCPLGGGIEFGETSDEALQREIREELGCGVIISQGPFAFDNIFDHHGTKGHDIILAYLIRLNDQEIYANQRFQICENRGSTHWVEWIDIAKFYSGEEVLFPKSLLSNPHWLTKG